MDLAWIAEVAGAKRARRGERIQSLWSGYGEILRVDLEDADVPSVIVKSVTPPARPGDDVGDARKRRSYDVERAFYETFSARCPAACRVPRVLGTKAGKGKEASWLFVLEDLDAAGFDLRRRAADGATLERALAWLASFHATFLGEMPNGLWKTGTYWHLATRREELDAIDDARIRAVAPLLDERLRGCTHRTLVHGDAKLANFCFAKNGGVAAVDFQYVGGGPGVKDVAYLIGGEGSEARVLETYFASLRRELEARGVDAAPIEAEWRALYPIACADFYRFLAGWSPSHFAHDRHAQRVLLEVARSLGV